MDQKSILPALAIVLLLIVFAAIYMRPEIESGGLLVREAPLYKNTVPQFSGGEIYSYFYRGDTNETSFNFSVRDLGSCILLQADGGKPICISKVTGNDKTFSNTSLEDPNLVFFNPWMLALQDNWKWNATLYFVLNKEQQDVGMVTYEVIGRRNQTGRDAFVVREKLNTGDEQIIIVDTKKRIALAIEGNGYTLNLTSKLE